MKAFKKLRKDTADQNYERRNKLTPKQQILNLDARLGANEGATKERTRLNKLIVTQ